jgi:hypothetical protein
MLLTREETAFDFGGATFDRERDRDLLAWIASQFLYGEVTGIQVGHWIMCAPDVESAKFLARQCVEELQHVDVFVEFFKWLGARPVKVHPIVRLLSTESADWEEHVALEMAQGEGFVLMIFYAIIACLPDEKLARRLDAACRQEEGHVSFGEEQTMKLLVQRPKLRKRLLGLHLLSLWAIKRFEKWISKRVDREHAVMRFVPEYLAKILQTTDLRLQRIGMTQKPLSEYGRLETFALICSALARKAARKLAFWRRWRRNRLTDTYMRDEYLAEVMKLAEVRNAAGIPVVKAA